MPRLDRKIGRVVVRDCRDEAGIISQDATVLRKELRTEKCRVKNEEPDLALFIFHPTFFCPEFYYRRCDQGSLKRGSRRNFSSVSDRRNSIRSRFSSAVSLKPLTKALLYGFAPPTPLLGPAAIVRPPAA